ncbi:hypothetical protein Bpfe_016740, partial [Biomphalaria pfeifferi]
LSEKMDSATEYRNYSLIGTIVLCLLYREKWITCIKKKPSLDVTFEPYPGPWTDSAVDTKVPIRAGWTQRRPKIPKLKIPVFTRIRTQNTGSEAKPRLSDL